MNIWIVITAAIIALIVYVTTVVVLNSTITKAFNAIYQAIEKLYKLGEDHGTN